MTSLYGHALGGNHFLKKAVSPEPLSPKTSHEFFDVLRRCAPISMVEPPKNNMIPSGEHRGENREKSLEEGSGEGPFSRKVTPRGAPLLMLAGGGTGGHLFPGLAVAEEWRRRHPGSAVAVVGTGRAVERRAVPAAGCELLFISARPLRGRNLGDQVLSIAALPLALVQAVELLRRFRPTAVVGLGGYASGPVVLAAAALRIPTAVMEQNTVPGSTNRLLSRLRAIDRAYLTYASSGRYFPARVVRVTGNPVRGSVLAARGAPLALDPPHVLVLGGSQGAQRLDLAVPEALARAGAGRRGLVITHQTAEARAESVRRAYDQLGLAAQVEPFIEDMAGAFRAATLVVCRAGATTLAELGVVGRPAVLVPFPHAIDDHQRRNAEELERAGAAVVVRDEHATPETLAPRIAALLDDPDTLRQMAARAAATGAVDASLRVVSDLEELTRVQR